MGINISSRRFKIQIPNRRYNVDKVYEFLWLPGEKREKWRSFLFVPRFMSDPYKSLSGERSHIYGSDVDHEDIRWRHHPGNH